MSKPLLSWDDFEEDAPVKSAANQGAALRAAENLKNLDTSAGVAELEEQGAAIAKRKAMTQAGLTNPTAQHSPMFTPGVATTPQSLNEANKRLQEATAKQIKQWQSGDNVFITSPDQLGLHGNGDMAVRVFNALQNSREAFDRGEAPAVDDKRLLNCSSDLNQLIPFKYNWSWSLYLTSCEHHWMVPEMGLEKCVEELDVFERNGGDTDYINKLIYRFYSNFKYRAHLYPEMVGLNVYRLTTNPECRQYQLRSSFESSTLHHVMDTVNELFDPLNKRTLVERKGEMVPSSIGVEQWKIDKYAFKERYKTAIRTIKDLHDLEYQTSNEDGSPNEANTANFLEQLIYLYGYVNFTMNIACIYQLKDWIRNEGYMENFDKMLNLMLRDMQTQTSFITNFLENAYMENPFALTEEMKVRVVKTFKSFRASEDDLLFYLVADDKQGKNVLDTFDYFVNKFLNDIGISGYASNKLTPNNQWFIQQVEGLQPKVDHDAGITGSGGNLSW